MLLALRAKANNKDKKLQLGEVQGLLMVVPAGFEPATFRV